MYCVIKTIENVGSTTEAGLTKTKIYFCEKKSLAVKYVRKRYEFRYPAIAKRALTKGSGVELLNSGMKGDGTWSNIEYVDSHKFIGDSGYKYTRESMMVVRGQEILDLPGGPSLKVE